MSNSKIAKNTLALYIRMFLSMGISLFTSRIVLQALGVDNYGIYVVVGGFVSLFVFFTGPLTSASSRFFAFEIGKGKNENLKIVFRSALSTHLFYAVIIVILLEAVGFYLFKNRLVIPPERMTAAVWVFHFSVAGVFIAIIKALLAALIIATERMKVYAYLGIADVIIKLTVAAAIVHSKGDKLVLYAFLLLAAEVFNLIAYHIYCGRNIREVYVLKPQINLPLQKTMLGFIGWTLIGQTVWVLNTQGISMLFNVFFGVAVNAALGIANMINGALNNFTQNFSIAMNPQIIKRYAAGDFNGMNSLVAQGTKYSFFLLFFVALPLLFQTEYLLSIWLVEVPHYAAVFTRLLIINTVIRYFSNTLHLAIHATGNIKAYQLVTGAILLFNIPVSYLFIKFGYPPAMAFYISIPLWVGVVFTGVLVVKMRIPQFSARKFIVFVLGTSALVAALSLAPPLIIRRYTTETLTSFFVMTSVCVISTFLSIVFVGLNKNEREWFYTKAKMLVKRPALGMD